MVMWDGAVLSLPHCSVMTLSSHVGSIEYLCYYKETVEKDNSLLLSHVDVEYTLTIRRKTRVSDCDLLEDEQWTVTVSKLLPPILISLCM